MKYWDYVIPNEPETGEGWGKVLIAEDGRFHAISDHGNYANWWTHIGDQSILEFIHRLANSPDYVCSKLKPEKRVDAAASIESIQAYIIQLRKDAEIDSSVARAMWEHVTQFSDDWEGLLRDEYTPEYLETPWEFAVTKYDADVWAFATRLMPRLAALIEKDLPAARRRHLKKTRDASLGKDGRKTTTLPKAAKTEGVSP